MTPEQELYSHWGRQVPTDGSEDILRLQCLEAEQAVLGCALLEEEAAGFVLTRCKPEDFYRVVHRAIFESMLTVYNERRPVDLLTVYANLRLKGLHDTCGGSEYLTALLGCVPTTAHTNAYIEVLKKRRELRLVYALRHGYGSDSPETLEWVENELETIREQSAWGDAPKAIGEYDVQGSVERFLTQRASFDHECPHFDIDAIDFPTSGLPWPGYVVLMGDSGMGKTCLAMQAAYHEAQAHGRPVIYYTLEMDVEAQIVPRLAMMHVGKRSSSYEELTEAGAIVLCLPLEFRDRAVTVEEVCAEVKRSSRSANPPRLVVVDYAQLLGTTRKLEETAKYRHISRSLKLLSNDAKVTVLTLSQVTYKPGTRDSESFGSRGFGQDADMEIEVDKQGATQHERRKNMEATVMVRKNRQPSGWVGDVKVEAYAWRLWELPDQEQPAKRERRDARND